MISLEIGGVYRDRKGRTIQIQSFSRGCFLSCDGVWYQPNGEFCDYEDGEFCDYEGRDYDGHICEVLKVDILKLEIGKWYRTREGGIHQVYQRHSSEKGFHADSGYWYYENGWLGGNGSKSKYDFIEEVPCPYHCELTKIVEGSVNEQ